MTARTYISRQNTSVKESVQWFLRPVDGTGRRLAAGRRLSLPCRASEPAQTERRSSCSLRPSASVRRTYLVKFTISLSVVNLGILYALAVFLCCLLCIADTAALKRRLERNKTFGLCESGEIVPDFFWILLFCHNSDQNTTLSLFQNSYKEI